MAKPTPSPAQQAAIETQVQNYETQQAALNESADLQDGEIARFQAIDDAFKALFDWYNDAIIKKYDAERRAINGTYILNPIVEADILNVSNNPPSGRLVPTPPATDIVRIAEFDAGAYTSNDPLNEEDHIASQAGVEDLLQNGVSGGTPTFTLTSLTSTSLTPSSTTLSMNDATGPMTIAANDIFIVHDGGTNAAVVKVLTATSVGANPPYTYNLTIELIVPPVGTISSGADVIDSFSGFTNGERTSKTASDPDLQPLMDSLIDQLELHLNNRKARLVTQLAALNTNEDPDATTNIGTAITQANNTDSFITSYLTTTDISNTGLASLASERGTRTAFLTTRVAQILAAYTGQTEDYYEQRYQTGNNRGNTSRGTLRSLKNAQTTKSTLQGMSTGLGAGITALEGILP